MEITRHKINEAQARRAKEAYSMSDYKEGEATSSYLALMDRFERAVNRLIEANKERQFPATSEQMASVRFYAEKYSEKLAAAFDRDNEITARCPSILIAGCSNFPVHKKEKQNAAAMFYLLYYLLKPREENVISLSPRCVSFDRKTAGEIFFVGLPATVQLVMNALSNVTLNYLMSAYAAGALSAVGIVKKIDQVPTYIVQGISSGVIPLLAYNYASGDYKRLWRCTYFAGVCSLAVTLSYLAMCETIPAALIRIFMEDGSAVSAGSVFLRLHCISIPFLSIISLIIAFFQATGRGRPALVLSFLRKGPIDIPMMALMNVIWPMYGIMAVQPMMDVTVASVCIATYRTMQKRDRRRAGAGL